jgi:hypothetical protein
LLTIATGFVVLSITDSVWSSKSDEVRRFFKLQCFVMHFSLSPLKMVLVAAVTIEQVTAMHFMKGNSHIEQF